MEAVLKIGNLELTMGSVSHTLGLPKTSKDYDAYLKYLTYQQGFEKRK